MGIPESIKKKTGFRKQVASGKVLEGLEIVHISKMNEQETKQCVESLWNKIIKNDQQGKNTNSKNS